MSAHKHLCAGARKTIVAKVHPIYSQCSLSVVVCIPGSIVEVFVCFRYIQQWLFNA
jgi:hypothetical protein